MPRGLPDLERPCLSDSADRSKPTAARNFGGPGTSGPPHAQARPRGPPGRLRQGARSALGRARGGPRGRPLLEGIDRAQRLREAQTLQLFGRSGATKLKPKIYARSDAPGMPRGSEASRRRAAPTVYPRARQLERLAAGLGTRLQNRARRETGPTPERETRRDHEKPHPQSQNRGFAGDSKIGQRFRGYSSMVLAEGKMRTSERCQDKAATICDRRGPGLATVEPPGAPEHAWPTP
ncbi:unnamed protein product [Prorocentrum cordatum]|uniref:Uncharacterized protein n=1 Tax=Prorocentrum cordatum TaxID=2364126 RepID=A0ABN9W403_9DINO|nr:unnamed protein product [Polarella glacialis]